MLHIILFFKYVALSKIFLNAIPLLKKLLRTTSKIVFWYHSTSAAEDHRCPKDSWAICGQPSAGLWPHTGRATKKTGHNTWDVVVRRWICVSRLLLTKDADMSMIVVNTQWWSQYIVLSGCPVQLRLEDEKNKTLAAKKKKPNSDDDVSSWLRLVSVIIFCVHEGKLVEL